MPMRKTALLWLFFVPCLTLQPTLLKAQVTFTMPVDTITTGQSEYSVPVTVQNFKSIVGAQFTVAWDNEVINITSIDQLGFDYLSLDNHFNIEQDSGWVNFLYLDLGLTGVSLEDNQVLFRVNFEVVGLPGDVSTLRFANEPTQREVTDTSSINTSEPVEAIFNDGQLIIEGTTSATSAAQPDRLRVVRTFPNPFPSDLTVSVFVEEAGAYLLEVLNWTGQVIHQHSVHLAPGITDYLLNPQIFPEAGTHIIRLSGHGLHATQRVLCTK